MKDTMRDASYGEYVRFCQANGLAFVPYEEYGFAFWCDFCQQHGLANAVATSAQREGWQRSVDERWKATPAP
jgi:hypothetical protein